MPTKQITICTTCGKPTCDGGIWRVVKVVNLQDRAERNLSQVVHPDNMQSCSLRWGRRSLRTRKGKAVGDRVTLIFNNWVNPSEVTLEKIED